MAKASFASKDFYSPGIFTDGNLRVIDARTVVAQYPPSRDTGEQTAPFLGAELTIQPLDASGQSTDDDPLKKLLRIEGNLDKMRPGLAESRDDDSPEDMGDALGAEGNCVFAEEGNRINSNSIFGRFIKSVEERGFKPGVLSGGFMPDLVGLAAHGITQKSEKRNIRGREVETNYFIIDKIIERPSESSGKKAPAAGKSAKSQPVNGAGDGESGAQAETIALQLLTSVAADWEGETRPQPKVYAAVYSRLVREKDRNKKLDASVTALLKSNEWLAAQAEPVGYTFENGQFTFAS